MVVIDLQHGLELMSIIAVMVNCALIGMSDLADRLFPGWGTAGRIIFIVLLEVTALFTLLMNHIIINACLILADSVEFYIVGDFGFELSTVI